MYEFGKQKTPGFHIYDCSYKSVRLEFKSRPIIFLKFPFYKKGNLSSVNHRLIMRIFWGGIGLIGKLDDFLDMGFIVFSLRSFNLQIW